MPHIFHKNNRNFDLLKYFGSRLSVQYSPGIENANVIRRALFKKLYLSSNYIHHIATGGNKFFLF